MGTAQEQARGSRVDAPRAAQGPPLHARGRVSTGGQERDAHIRGDRLLMNIRLGHWPGRTGTSGGVPGGLGVGAPPTREGGKLLTHVCVVCPGAVCSHAAALLVSAVCAVVALVL